MSDRKSGAELISADQSAHVAEDAVQVEPVSAAISLLTGSFTGKPRKTSPSPALNMLSSTGIFASSSEIPYASKQGISAAAAGNVRETAGNLKAPAPSPVDLGPSPWTGPATAFSRAGTPAAGTARRARRRWCRARANRRSRFAKHSARILPFESCRLAYEASASMSLTLESLSE